MRILSAMILAVCVAAFGLQAEDVSPELQSVLKGLKKHVGLGSVNRSSVRDEERNKIEVIKTTTEQDEDSPFLGIMRFTMEFTDKAGDVYFGRAVVKQRPHPKNYDGKDEWEFQVPHGELDYPKLSAYAMEFGFETNGTFVAVDEKLMKAPSGDEILARNKGSQKKLKIQGKSKALRQVVSGDTGGGE